MKIIKCNIWKDVFILIASAFMCLGFTQVNATIIYTGDGGSGYTFRDYTPKQAVSGSTITVAATGYEWDVQWDDTNSDGIGDVLIGAYQDWMYGETVATVFGNIGDLVPVTVILRDSYFEGGADDFAKEERVLIEIVGVPIAPTLLLLVSGVLGLFGSKRLFQKRSGSESHNNKFLWHHSVA